MDLSLNAIAAYWHFWVGFAIVVALFWLTRLWSIPVKLPYESRGQLVTKPELRFYKSLLKAVQDDWEIFAMVRIADLLKVRAGHPQRRKWLNKILAKHIDFVLCDPTSLKPICCIELDDRSHERPDRIERDIFVNRAFESAGIPLLRIATQKQYRAREIRELIDGVL
ncbi:MAG: DUF2726 domain-containing protein [Planctomycetota bacterium]